MLQIVTFFRRTKIVLAAPLFHQSSIGLDSADGAMVLARSAVFYGRLAKRQFLESEGIVAVIWPWRYFGFCRQQGRNILCQSNLEEGGAIGVDCQSI